jgi:L-alanine-DL-glutamate epimerase-like enolase superfamily enzyme
MEKRFEQTAYVICHNGADVIHPTKVEAGTMLTSGQPEFEEFASEEEWEARLAELGYDTTKLKIAQAPGAEGPSRLKSVRAEGPGPFLSAEERKALSPEERKALRAERKAERIAAKS